MGENITLSLLPKSPFTLYKYTWCSTDILQLDCITNAFILDWKTGRTPASNQAKAEWEDGEGKRSSPLNITELTWTS